MAFELCDNPVCNMLHLGKNDCLPDVAGLQNLREQVILVAAVDKQDRLRDAIDGRLIGSYRDTNRRPHHRISQ